MALSYSKVKNLKRIRGIGKSYLDITLDASYVDGGWPVTAAAIQAYTGINNYIWKLDPPASRAGYQFEGVPVSGNASAKIKATLSNVSESFNEAAWAEWTQYPAYTATEQASTLAKVYDLSAVEYQDLATSDTGAAYAAALQLFPDSPAAGDYALFGAAVPFAQLGLDMSATVAVYDAAAVIGWDYWDGTAWADLDASIIDDGSGSTGQTGDYAFEQDGVITFVPPQDWAASTIDGQAAYWIKATVETSKGANMTTVPLMATEHDINIPDTGYVPTHNGTIASVEINDAAATIHSGNDLEFLVINTTTGESSEVLVFAQDTRTMIWPLVNKIDVSIGDKLAVVITVEDGTNEAGIVTLTFHYSSAEALADDPELAGIVLRCEVAGS